jgi:hypothetical protein
MSRFHVNTELAAGPPPEVQAEVDVAWERARELFEAGIDLHFELDAELGRVWAELRLPDGRTARLSARQALAVCCAN